MDRGLEQWLPAIADAIASAKAMVEREDYGSAVSIYTKLLNAGLSVSARGEVMTNLGAVLYLSSRQLRGDAALDRLAQARERLASALDFRPRTEVPGAWAVTSANLALVYQAYHEISGRGSDLMFAHLALDGAEQVSLSTGDTALQDWVLAIRQRLLELRNK